MVAGLRGEGQHTGLPSSLSAQAWAGPALMAVNRSSSGGDACPAAAFPQHTGLPSKRSTQASVALAATLPSLALRA